MSTGCVVCCSSACNNLFIIQKNNVLITQCRVSPFRRNSQLFPAGISQCQRSAFLIDASFELAGEKNRTKQKFSRRHLRHALNDVTRRMFFEKQNIENGFSFSGVFSLVCCRYIFECDNLMYWNMIISTSVLILFNGTLKTNTLSKMQDGSS